MSSGYKHLYSCVTFILFMVVVNFYKNKIHQAREREASVRAKMRGVSPKPSYQLLRRRITLDEEAAILQRGLGNLDDDLEELYPNQYYDNDALNPVLERMKEYPDQCRDMEVFYSSGHRKSEFSRHNVATQSTRIPPINGPPTPENTKTSNSSIYVFLSVLIILIIAAAVDIAKHVRAIPRRDDQVRRLSLQNYQALIREKQKQFRMMKQHCSQPSMSIQQSIDDPFEPPLKPIMPAPPAPLLRRQSVPVGLMGSQRNVPLFRRPSVDSFGLGERCGPDLDGGVYPNGSPTEMRRRVRMLHRH